MNLPGFKKNYLKENFWDEEKKQISGRKFWNAIQPFIERGELIVSEGTGDRTGLKLATYSKTYQLEHYSDPWDPIVQNCRGVIFDTTDDYKIVALPFAKFFNYGEAGIHTPAPGAKIEAVYTKVDGSLGICFYWRGKWHVTTRGSLNSDIGVEGQKIFDETISQPSLAALFLPNIGHHAYTYLLEIIFKENRICVNYHDERKLVYLGMRSSLTGENYFGSSWLSTWHNMQGIPRIFENVKHFDFTDFDAVTEYVNSQKGDEFEGVVMVIDGELYKVKGEDYKRLHRIFSHFSFKRVLEAVQDGTIDQMKLVLPEEFLDLANEYIAKIQERVDYMSGKVFEAFQRLPGYGSTKKDFALAVIEQYKGTFIPPFVFKLFDVREQGQWLLDRQYYIDTLKQLILPTLKNADFKIEE